MHTIVGAGAEGAMDAGNMLKPALARGELHAIGATTVNEYRKHVEKDPALERRFQPVFVGEPSVADTISILRGLKDRYELHHKVRIQDAALVEAARLSHRYITDRFLPDKAIDLVDEAASRLRIEIDSMPTEVDEVRRRIGQLEIERRGLEKEQDEASRARLVQTGKELAARNEEFARLKSRWDAEKQAIQEVAAAKQEIDQLRNEQAKAEREADFQRAAETSWIACFSASQRDLSRANSSLRAASSFSVFASRAREPSSCSFSSPRRSISSCPIRRRTSSTSVGIESISMRSRDAASSTRSIALSGRNRSVM